MRLFGRRPRDGLRRVPVEQPLQFLTGLEVVDTLRRHVHLVGGPGVVGSALPGDDVRLPAKAIQLGILAPLTIPDQ